MFEAFMARIADNLAGPVARLTIAPENFFCSG
jgi:hypothetical protein